MSNKKEWPVSPADYLSDENVIAMTIEQEGMYWRLMMHCWIKGVIPKNAEGISKICKGMDIKRVKLNWESIKMCWKICPENPDFLIHPRIKRDMEKIKLLEGTISMAEVTPEIKEVFDHYIKVSGRNPNKYRMNQQKKVMVRRALGRGWEVKDLKTAIDNMFGDNWPGRRKYSGMEYCIGNWAEKGDAVEKWLNETPNKSVLDEMELD